MCFYTILKKKSPSLVRSSFELIIDLCRDLSCYIKNGRLPHYFLVECNLLETVDSTEKHLAQTVITEILSDPLNALLKSHARPSLIYGGISPSHFVTAFRQLAHNPTSRRYQTELLALLAQADLHRKLHHMLTQMMDLCSPKIQVRSKPAGLVSDLERLILHECYQSSQAAKADFKA